jgi:oxalate decarboxylase/phosphoglucose isomerase-like protein (cupin superfamily)
MRGSRPLFIVADSSTVGSRTLMAAYEDVPPGDSGRTHRHMEEEEIIFVHRGQLEIVLDDSIYKADAGASVFIPRGTWVRFRNASADTAGFFFVFNAPGFDKCLRALSAGRGETYRPPAADEQGRINTECHWQVRN